MPVDFPPQFLFFALFFLLVIALAVLGAMAAARRRKELSAWAAANGLAFNPARDSAMDDRFPSFRCLRQGDNRYAFNIIRGPWRAREFLGFDYHYQTHSTDSKGRRQTHHHTFSAVILSSGLPLRPLLIRPEGIWDKITEFFGADDIDFESIDFSRQFYVKAEDKRWAYDVLHARAMEMLLAAPRFVIQFDSDCVMAMRQRTFTPADFEAAATLIGDLLNLMPEYLVKQQRGTTAV